ncbi:MAG: hypothetical protein D3906_18045 [Candidatus Electrothrix sp. AUS1_2]|nr:hypothetical protein [Candidatus Electrothrix sp. AUS1_2]
MDNLESEQDIVLYMGNFSRLSIIKQENWKNISSLLIFFAFPGYQQLSVDNMETQPVVSNTVDKHKNIHKTRINSPLR